MACTSERTQFMQIESDWKINKIFALLADLHKLREAVCLFFTRKLPHVTHKDTYTVILKLYLYWPTQPVIRTHNILMAGFHQSILMIPATCCVVRDSPMVVVGALCVKTSALRWCSSARVCKMLFSYTRPEDTELHTWCHVTRFQPVPSDRRLARWPEVRHCLPMEENGNSYLSKMHSLFDFL